MMCVKGCYDIKMYWVGRDEIKHEFVTLKYEGFACLRIEQGWSVGQVMRRESSGRCQTNQRVV